VGNGKVQGMGQTNCQRRKQEKQREQNVKQLAKDLDRHDAWWTVREGELSRGGQASLI
jgi:hypothetical protein